MRRYSFVWKDILRIQSRYRTRSSCTFRCVKSVNHRAHSISRSKLFCLLGATFTQHTHLSLLDDNHDTPYPARKDQRYSSELLCRARWSWSSSSRARMQLPPSLSGVLANTEPPLILSPGQPTCFRLLVWAIHTPALKCRTSKT